MTDDREYIGLPRPWTTSGLCFWSHAMPSHSAAGGSVRDSRVSSVALPLRVSPSLPSRALGDKLMRSTEPVGVMPHARPVVAPPRLTSGSV
eukprot:1655618-Heterocapsa_arctica.AAC.1